MRPAFSFVACLVLSVGAAVSSAFAEKIELVTYYPTSASNTMDRLHASRATIGNTPYSLNNPAVLTDGTLLVANRLGVGLGLTPFPANSRLHVVGVDGQASSVVFMPGAGAGSELRMGIGTVNPQGPAPNGQAGNLDVNDIWLRAANAGGGKWLSQTPQVIEKTLASNTTFTTSERVIVDEVRITTHGGPLLIQGKAWIQRPAGPSHAEIRIRRVGGGGPFGPIVDGWRWFSNEPYAGRGMTAVVFGTETLPAGTYAYVLTGQCDGGATWNVINAYTKLIVTEL